MKRMIVCLCFLAVMVLPARSGAEDRWDLMRKAFGFSAGFFSGLVFHELGHQAMAGIEGVDMDWHGTKWWANSDDSSKLRRISLGGFGAEIISSEIMLSWDKIPKDNSYVLGWLAWNIIRPITYAIQHEFSHDGFGDLRCYEKNGGKSRYIEAVIVGHAILSGIRILKNEEFHSWLGCEPKIRLLEDGFLFTVNFSW